MNDVPRLEADIAFFAPEDGGRRQLPVYPGYMPHLTVGDGEHLGVRFVDGPDSTPGVPARYVLELMYHPAVCYEDLQPDVAFAVREGNRIVAVGRVVGSLPDV